jgi:carboxyl-terminal processing protease
MDFRDNLGGTLEDSIQTADLFVESGTLIELFDLDHTDRRSAIPGDPGEGRTVVLLQNGHSASASEIVIASLRDNLSSHIIGTRSFGKAVSQSFFRFTDDPGGLQLVTGGIRSPSGESYNEIGIEPDQVVAFVLDPESFSDSQLDAAIAFAMTLLDLNPDEPIQPSALEQIKAFRQTLDTGGSPILLDYIEQ